MVRKRSSIGQDQEAFQTEPKVQELTIPSSQKGPRRKSTLSGRNSNTSSEGGLNVAGQPRRKSSNPNAIKRSNSNKSRATDGIIPAQKQKGLPRATSPSPYDSRDVVKSSKNGLPRSKLSAVTAVHKQKSSLMSSPEIKVSKEDSCKVDIEEISKMPE